MSVRDNSSWIEAMLFGEAVTTKKAYDITQNLAYHSVNINEYGTFEKVCKRLKKPFNPDDYVTVELHSGTYRFPKDGREYYIDSFLERASRRDFQMYVMNGQYIEGQKMI